MFSFRGLYASGLICQQEEKNQIILCEKLDVEEEHSLIQRTKSSGKDSPEK